MRWACPSGSFSSMSRAAAGFRDVQYEYHAPTLLLPVPLMGRKLRRIEFSQTDLPLRNWRPKGQSAAHRYNFFSPTRRTICGVQKDRAAEEVREVVSVVDQPVFRKEDVRFPAEGGIELSAWLFVPERRTARLSAITMAHGYAGTKYHGIEPVAEASAQAGFVVLLHIPASATAAANRGPT